MLHQTATKLLNVPQFSSQILILFNGSDFYLHFVYSFFKLLQSVVDLCGILYSTIAETGAGKEWVNNNTQNSLINIFLNALNDKLQSLHVNNQNYF